MIQFLQPLDTQKLRMAFNNDIIRFYSNNAIPALSCRIYDTFQKINVTLYPNPQGQFYFNFKPYVSALINTRNFNDTLQTNIMDYEPDSFIYNFSQGTFTQRNITFEVYYENNTTESVSFVLSWLAGVQQPGSFHNFRISDMLILSPFVKDSANKYYLKYWKGYPFDIPFYSNGINLKVKNETNLLSMDFNTLGYGERLVVSDGRTNVTLEDILPLSDGHNNLVFMKGNQPSINDKYLILEKSDHTKGVYLKWLNTMGGYNYWLFENTYSIDRSTKQLGEINTDFNNIDSTFGRTATLGKESQDTIKVVAELLNEDERAIVQGILDSPKIYLFTGRPYAQNDYNDWVEVTLKTGNARIKNARQPLTNFTFDLELPQRYTQTL